MTKSEFTPITVCVYCKERKTREDRKRTEDTDGNAEQIQIDIFSMHIPIASAFIRDETQYKCVANCARSSAG